MYLAKGTLFNAYPFKVKGGFKIMNEERKVAGINKSVSKIVGNDEIIN